MRMRTITILAVILAMAVLVPIQGADAETPARLYFFNDDNECIAEVILIPGEPLDGADIPWHGSYKEWYDDGAERVYAGRTFDSGDYIIRAYDTNHPPKLVQQEHDYTVVIIASTVIVISVVALIAYLVVFKK